MAKFTARIVAFGAVATIATIAFTSGVVNALFSTKPIDGQTCVSAYQAGYGYGYDCTEEKKNTQNSSSSTGGGGAIFVGGSSPSTGSSTSTPSTPSSTSTTTSSVVTPVIPVEPTKTPETVVVPSVTLFPSFHSVCGNEAKNLTDSSVVSYYDVLKVMNRSNTGRYLTRAEFLKLVLNSAKVDVSAESAPSYTDVSATHSLVKYISYATRNGIVSGQNNKFRPDAMITRGEAMKILVNATNLKLSVDVTTFSDVSSSYSLARYIQTAKDNCIVHGRKTWDGKSTTGNTLVFEPFDGITLAETVKVLYNVATTR